MALPLLSSFQNLLVVLVYIPLLSCNVGHFLICLLAFWVSSRYSTLNSNLLACFSFKLSDFFFSVNIFWIGAL